MPRDRELDALHAGLFAVEPRQQLDVVALGLAVAQVHAQQHLRPVLGLGAAGSRMDRHEGVLVVVRAGELEIELEGAKTLLELVEERGKIVVRQTFGEKLAPGRQLLAVGDEPLVGLELALQGPALAQDRRAHGLVFPESLDRGLLVERRDACF